MFHHLHELEYIFEWPAEGHKSLGRTNSEQVLANVQPSNLPRIVNFYYYHKLWRFNEPYISVSTVNGEIRGVRKDEIVMCCRKLSHTWLNEQDKKKSFRIALHRNRMYDLVQVHISESMKLKGKHIFIYFNLYSGGWSPIGSTRHCGH
jgi:hypothetical protein